MSDKEPKKVKMFLFSEKRAAALIEEALLNERLAAFLMKNYETDDLATNDIIFSKLCEFFMCSRALYESVTNIELNKEKRYSEKDDGFGYVIESLEAKALQMLVSTMDMVKLELKHYNLNFTVH